MSFLARNRIFRLWYNWRHPCIGALAQVVVCSLLLVQEYSCRCFRFHCHDHLLPTSPSLKNSIVEQRHDHFYVRGYL